VKTALLLLAAIPALAAPDGGNVLVVVNDASLLSRRIGDYYVRKRAIPLTNVCHLKSVLSEEISREEYDQRIEAPIAGCLSTNGLRERVLYIVTTFGVPLRVAGSGNALQTSVASVDSELTLLYSKMQGFKFKAALANQYLLELL